jgi:cytochrome c
MTSAKYLFAAALAALMAGTTIARAQDAAALAQKHACTACHALDKKLVGPAYEGRGSEIQRQQGR